jgi:hypothetical protein
MSSTFTNDKVMATLLGVAAQPDGLSVVFGLAVMGCVQLMFEQRGAPVHMR